MARKSRDFSGDGNIFSCTFCIPSSYNISFCAHDIYHSDNDYVLGLRCGNAISDQR